MKSEEKSIQAISVQAHSEAADNRLLRKKLQARDKRVVELEAMVSNLNNQLCEKVDQLNDMMQKLVAFMTGNGEINLSDSLREAVVLSKIDEENLNLDTKSDDTSVQSTDRIEIPYDGSPQVTVDTINKYLDGLRTKDDQQG